MAEFCLKCFNDMNDSDFTEKEVFTKVWLCEGCGKALPCVYKIKRKYEHKFLAAKKSPKDTQTE